VLLAAGCLLLGACRRPQDPATTYRVFAYATRTGDEDAAWSMLSARSQASLDARAREVAARSGGAVPATGKDLLLGDAPAAAPRIRSALTVRESADAAVVRVEAEGAATPADVTLVREGGRWKVLLPELPPGDRKP
jgi:hypothetical protein